MHARFFAARAQWLMVCAAMPLKIVPTPPNTLLAVGASMSGPGHERRLSEQVAGGRKWLRWGMGRESGEFFLVIEGEDVRGGFALRRQEFLVAWGSAGGGKLSGPWQRGDGIAVCDGRSADAARCAA